MIEILNSQLQNFAEEAKRNSNPDELFSRVQILLSEFQERSCCLDLDNEKTTTVLKKLGQIISELKITDDQKTAVISGYNSLIMDLFHGQKSVNIRQENFLLKTSFSSKNSSEKNYDEAEKKSPGEKTALSEEFKKIKTRKNKKKIAEQFSQNAIYSSVYTSLQKYKKNAENIRNRGRSHNNADSAKNASGETNSTKISAKTQQTVTRSRNSKIRNFSIAGIVALVLIAILFLANLL